MNELKKKFALMTLAVVMFNFAFAQASSAATGETVVINEIAWAGSADSSNDEWIELYNHGSSDVNLSGWTLEDDGAVVVTFEEVVIGPYEYFLIEDSEDATSAASDMVAGLSFANTGDEIVLKNASGEIVDSVGEWFAGDSATKASMERVDPATSDWATAVSGNGTTASAGSDILGTPGSVNSTYAGTGPQIAVSGNGPNFTVNVSDVDELFAYGVDVIYDPAVLNFVDAVEGDFLKNDGASTSFFAGLENGEQGRVVVAAARLEQPETGVSGEGTLFNLNFEIVGEGSSELVIAGSSFAAGVNGDLPVQFVNGNFGDAGSGEPGGEPGGGSTDPVTGLNIDLGEMRYSFDLSWTASDADQYLIMRKQFDGSYVQIGQTAETSFVDAANIVPFVNYEYKVIALKAGVQSEAVSGEVQETRGLVGDNDRSDRVDGRDLENLARAYTMAAGDLKYDALVDTTFDGIIDGSDLIDIGANFGLTYTSE